MSSLSEILSDTISASLTPDQSALSDSGINTSLEPTQLNTHLPLSATPSITISLTSYQALLQSQDTQALSAPKHFTLVPNATNAVLVPLEMQPPDSSDYYCYWIPHTSNSQPLDSTSDLCITQPQPPVTLTSLTSVPVNQVDGSITSDSPTFKVPVSLFSLC